MARTSQKTNIIMPDINELLYLNISVETVKSLREYLNIRHTEIGELPYSKITQKLKDEYEYVGNMSTYLKQWLDTMAYKEQQLGSNNYSGMLD